MTRRVPIGRWLRVRMVRLWLGEGTHFGWIIALAMLGWGLLIFAEYRASTKDETLMWMAILLVAALLPPIWLGRLQKLAFDEPASADLIANFLALEPKEVRERVIVRHEAWRARQPTDLLTISLVNSWCRMAAREIAAETAPLLPAYAAAVAQDRGFLPLKEG